MQDMVDQGCTWFLYQHTEEDRALYKHVDDEL